MAELDKIIHERARLRILTYLAASDKDKIPFNELQDKLDLSSGNLSIQLKKLKQARYITIDKSFKDNKPFTTVALTPTGSEALSAYIDEMERLIGDLKNSKGERG